MIRTSFAYKAPTTLPDALALLAQDGHQVLAADHSLVSDLKRGRAAAATLVSLRKVPGLGAIESHAGYLAIGTSASYADLRRHAALAQYPVLAQALATIPDTHLLHHSTLGGALHHGGRSHAPVLAALLALEATALVHGAATATKIPVQQLLQTPLAAGQLVTQVLLPIDPQAASQYLTLAQPLGYYAGPGVAAAVHLRQGRLVHLRLVLAGISEQPLRLMRVEEALVGQAPGPAALADAAALLDEEPLLTGASTLDGAYQLHLVKVLVRRSLTALFA